MHRTAQDILSAGHHLLDLLDGHVDVIRLTPDSIAAVADVGIALVAVRALARAQWVHDDTRPAVRTAQRRCLEDGTLLDLLGSVAKPAGNLCGNTGRGSMVDEDLAVSTLLAEHQLRAAVSAPEANTSESPACVMRATESGPYHSMLPELFDNTVSQTCTPENVPTDRLE